MLHIDNGKDVIEVQIQSELPFASSADHTLHGQKQNGFLVGGIINERKMQYYELQGHIHRIFWGS